MDAVLYPGLETNGCLICIAAFLCINTNFEMRGKRSRCPKSTPWHIQARFESARAHNAQVNPPD